MQAPIRPFASATRAMIVVAMLSAAANVARAQSQPGASPTEQPRRYEVSINGEHFTIDGDRLVKVKNADKPGVAYEVAVRLAEYQRWRLGNVRFDYHLGFQVSDDETATPRTATLRHGLGFVMIVTNLGGAMNADDQQKTLAELSSAVQATLKGSTGANVQVTAPQVKKMGSAQVRGLTISSDDANGVERSSLVYLISGPTFTCSCVVEFYDTDRDDVMPLIKPTLESFEDVEAKKPAVKKPEVKKPASKKYRMPR